MRLGNFTGSRWPSTCACGCGHRIEPGPSVEVVVDLESRPRRTWLPEHAPASPTIPENGQGGGQPRVDPARPPPQGPGLEKGEKAVDTRSPSAPSVPSQSPPKRDPRYRTLVGQRWPSKCACGCGEILPAGAAVELVLEVGSRPRKVWVPDHSPEADRSRAYGATPGGAPRDQGVA